MAQKRSTGTGIGAGVAAGVVGAVVWAIVTDAINARIGYLALGVGALVGLAVGRFGRGPVGGPLPFVAAGIALVSVVVGDTFGWASSAADEAQKAGLDLSTLDLVKGLVTGTVEVLGAELPIREVYRDDFDVFVLLMLVLGVVAAFQLARTQLAAHEATAPAAPPEGQADTAPQVDGGQPPYGTPESTIDLDKRPER